MKKRQIEQIPYLGLEKTSRKKGVKYIGVTALKTIGGKEHLFVEIYKNERGAKKNPKVRIVLCENDFGNFIPETGRWTRAKIKQGTYRGNFIWSTEHLDLKETILACDGDLERIRGYCKPANWWPEEWTEFIDHYQSNITERERNRTRERKYERRQQALADRIAHTRELPEEEIMSYAEDKFWSNLHYLYYKKHGSFAKIACSKCGGVTDARWKDGISYESQFQRRTEEPREGEYGRCPLCGTVGKYKCQGKVKKEHNAKRYLFLGQRYKEAGMVMRYIEVGKEWKLGLSMTDKGLEMHNASEEVYGTEIARAYFEPGKDVQIDYHKHSYYSGKDFWDDCNLYGMSNIPIRDGHIMPETYGEMKDTMFRYSALDIYETGKGTLNPIDYLKRYQQTPQIEMLVKMELTGIVDELVRRHYGIVTDENADRPDRFLGIHKDRVKQLIESKGDVDLLKAMQMEKRMGQRWTDQQIRDIRETGLGRGQIEQALPYMTIQKLLNRIKTYAGCEYGTGCSGAYQRIRTAADTYTDYLYMRKDLGYDLENMIYQRPRDLIGAHKKMVLETNHKKMDEHIRKKEAEYPRIRKQYKKLRRIYCYEDGSYLIRPARSAGEIILEGKALHHCVGGSGYLRRHDSGESYILMLRAKGAPEMPYITVEIDAERNRIRQWHGEYNRKPDEEQIDQWIKGYTEQLNEKSQVRMRAAIA